MTGILKSHEKLWIYSMHKRFQVRAIFATDAETNAYLERHANTGVIASVAGCIFVADLYGSIAP